ncbi:unnamed protein product [Parascedosporium putredinis]|uniref:Alpha-glucuronidase n=1 Tax=Parascedosporium putredinis TaxID=1442378 RepID=A0A9P1M8A8_9PEZI|nr:unnamed protein product [Parascedosporium putredinis]CAI7992276.1 unnamed protein product [Parascedosporium putredinis]
MLCQDLSAKLLDPKKVYKKRTIRSSLLGLVAAEDGLAGWLRYAPIDESVIGDYAAPTNIVLLNATDGSPIASAGAELEAGLSGVLGAAAKISEEAACDAASSVIVGTAEAFGAACGDLPEGAADLVEDGFWLSTEAGEGAGVQIIGQNERGALYGAFEYLSMIAQGNFTKLSYATNPATNIRWINHWDNLNAGGNHGSVERGYAGPSLFFANNGVVSDQARIKEYARLLASIRINAIVINNVNADAGVISDRNLDAIAKIADTFRTYGVRLGLSLNFASPQSAGGLSTFDPLNDSVISWWTRKTEDIYKRIPDFAGYLVKANSEGQPGPLTYQRTLADGANMFARALKPFGGVIMFRAFVYNQLDYNNKKADRANAAVEFFKSLNGKFEDNVVVQIKYGPIDFQVREPASPLFANLPTTNMAIELQITQEYLGQQAHLFYLAPLWREILDFDTRWEGEELPVRDILTGKRPGGKTQAIGGFAAVSNVGQEKSWLGSHLAMSNLYSYGRLAWNPWDDPVVMLEDWTRLTFGLDDQNYTGNLGVQTLTDITGNHYGPNPSSQDNNGWGQWTRADRNGIGMDRTVATGTGNAGQYPRVETTPENLILWFHHLPWTHELSTGKTVIQHFYDAHYAGAETAQTFPLLWRTLEGKIDDERYEAQLYRLEYQAGHSVVWRDFICRFYNKMSGVADALDRVNNHVWRIEAESMTLSGYSRANANPGEAASGSVVTAGGGGGTASAQIAFDSGVYDIAVGYFDVSNGKASWTLSIDDTVIGEWQGDVESRISKATSNGLDGHSAARVTFRG